MLNSHLRREYPEALLLLSLIASGLVLMSTILLAYDMMGLYQNCLPKHFLTIGHSESHPFLPSFPLYFESPALANTSLFPIIFISFILDHQMMMNNYLFAKENIINYFHFKALVLYPSLFQMP